MSDRATRGEAIYQGPEGWVEIEAKGVEMTVIADDAAHRIRTSLLLRALWRRGTGDRHGGPG